MPRSMGWLASMRGGAAFGLISGVLTTLGLIVGLHSGTDSRSAVAAGIATIAVADALSDALGMHVSEEAAGADVRSTWIAAFTTFGSKLSVASTFLLPVLLLPLDAAVLVSIGWGVILVTVSSAYTARLNSTSVLAAVVEHLIVAAVVLSASQGIGMLIRRATG